MEISEIIEYVKEVQEYKVSIEDYLDILALWYRDMVYFKATRDIDGIIFKDEIRTIRETVRVCSYEGVEEVMKAIETAKARLAANVNFDLTMELLFLVDKGELYMVKSCRSEIQKRREGSITLIRRAIRSRPGDHVIVETAQRCRIRYGDWRDP